TTSSAAANHRLMVLGRAPGESEGRLEFSGVIDRRLEVVAGTQDGRQILGLRDANAIESSLRIPSQAVVQSETRTDPPDVLKICAVLIVVAVVAVSVCGGQ